MLIHTALSLLVRVLATPLLRIDNRRQSITLLALHYSLAMYYIESYYIPNESLYFCLSNPINEIIITLIFQKV